MLEDSLSADLATILVVEDCAPNIRLLAEVLQPEYRITFATNGQDALERLREQVPDMVLLDVMLPDMDGYEICRRIKNAPETQDVPVIFLTAMRMEEHETRGLELGAVDYICKPYSPGVVRARVKAHMDLKRHRDALRELALADGLTGIANRRRFDEFLAMEWGRAIRESAPISLMLIDIDHFKPLNDELSHAAGDDCLRRVARILESCVRRPADLIARYGGDEFAAVLPKTAGLGALRIGEVMRERVAGEAIAHGHSPVAGHVTVSVGIASTTPERHARVPLLLETADKALYEAKRGGRNAVHGIEL
ncbi:MAG: diguanylate cyclase [Gammaproteobacteria bacterium]|nr:diguanylate cyclase [Gammaproteobacteria bacterium]